MKMSYKTEGKCKGARSSDENVCPEERNEYPLGHL
jgi:hypothetical protein